MQTSYGCVCVRMVSYRATIECRVVLGLLITDHRIHQWPQWGPFNGQGRCFLHDCSNGYLSGSTTTFTAIQRLVIRFTNHTSALLKLARTENSTERPTTGVGFVCSTSISQHVKLHHRGCWVVVILSCSHCSGWMMVLDLPRSTAGRAVSSDNDTTRGQDRVQSVEVGCPSKFRNYQTDRTIVQRISNARCHCQSASNAEI